MYKGDFMRKIVLNHCSKYGRSDINITADYMAIFIWSFRTFDNENPIIILSDSEELFARLKDMIDLKDVTMQKVDYTPYYKSHSYLPLIEPWNVGSFSKLFLTEIIQDDFLYFDSDILMFTKLGDDIQLVEPQAILCPCTVHTWGFVSTGIMQWHKDARIPKAYIKSLNLSPNGNDTPYTTDEWFMMHSRLGKNNRESIKTKPYDPVTMRFKFFKEQAPKILRVIEGSKTTNLDTLCYHYFSLPKPHTPESINLIFSVNMETLIQPFFNLLWQYSLAKIKGTEHRQLLNKLHLIVNALRMI